MNGLASLPTSLGKCRTAAWIRISTLPCFIVIASIPRSISIGSVMSKRYGWVIPLPSDDTFGTFSMSRSQPTTIALRRTRLRTSALPSPPAAPVTTAIWPASDRSSIGIAAGCFSDIDMDVPLHMESANIATGNANMPTFDFVLRSKSIQSDTGQQSPHNRRHPPDCPRSFRMRTLRFTPLACILPLPTCSARGRFSIRYVARVKPR